MYIIFKLNKPNAMTCFWSGILNLLDLQELNHVFGTTHKSKLSPKSFVKLLKRKNILVNDVKHNNTNITINEINENFERITEINVNEIFNGYLCSAFEPVLFLICHLFSYDIEHIFDISYLEYCDKSIITYTSSKSKGKLMFKSNHRHFEAIKKEIY